MNKYDMGVPQTVFIVEKVVICFRKLILKGALAMRCKLARIVLQSLMRDFYYYFLFNLNLLTIIISNILSCITAVVKNICFLKIAIRKKNPNLRLLNF